MLKFIGSFILVVLSATLLCAQNYRDSTFLLVEQHFGAEGDSLSEEGLLAKEWLQQLTPASHDTLTMIVLYQLAQDLNGEPRQRSQDLLMRMAKRGATGEVDPVNTHFYITMLVNALLLQHNNGGGVSSLYQALEWAQKAEDANLIAACYLHIGTNFFNKKDYSAAIENWLKVYELDQAALRPEKLARAAFKLGQVYMITGELEESQVKFRQVIEMGQQHHDTASMADAYMGMGYLQFRKEDFQGTKKQFELALKLNQQSGNITSQFRNLYALGRLAERVGDWASMANYISQLNDLLEAAPNQTDATLSDSYDILLRYYEHQGDFRNALEAQKNKSSALLRVYNERSVQQAYDQKYQFEYQQQALADSLENAIAFEKQEADIQRRTMTNWFLGAFLLLALVFGGIFINRFRLIQRQKGIIETEKSKLDQAILQLNESNGELNLANAKLQELDASKSRFFTNISHEFRTPLTVISGMAEQITEPVSAKELIRRNTQQLLGLINQILDLRKLESGNLTLALIQSDVIQFLKYGTESFESLAISKSLSLSFRSQIAEQMMDFDPDKLLMIHANLLSNAIKFTPAGGQVRVEVDIFDENRLGITVADTGKGIAADKLPMIFDRFYQVDDSSTREGEGTGIGLALTQELVRLMGGEIKAESELGKGSRFKVHLPITRQAALESDLPANSNLLAPITLAGQAELLPSPLASKGERPSLLIIEDNPDIVRYLFSLLEDQYELYAAPDGQAGIEAALEQVPDLIITDVMMPHKNGYEVCEALKLDERTSHIPIVMLTAKADQPSRLEGYKRGADAYLAKPFDKEELAIRLAKLLEIRRTLQQRYQSGAMPPSSEDPALQAEDTFLAKARELILAHLDNPDYRGDSLGEDLGMSRTNFYRKLKALTGESPSYFIRAVRADKAKELLQNPTLNVSEIAYMTGFNNPGYFNRIFKTLFDLTPSEFREQKLS